MQRLRPDAGAGVGLTLQQWARRHDCDRVAQSEDGLVWARYTLRGDPRDARCTGQRLIGEVIHSSTKPSQSRFAVSRVRVIGKSGAGWLFHKASPTEPSSR